MTEHSCEHLATQKVKCCGGSERQLLWCKKYGRHYEAIVCQMCKQGEPPAVNTDIPGRFEKLGNIAEGYAGLAVDAAAHLLQPSKHPSRYSQMVERRLEACGQCEHRTYLHILEYNNWIKENGGFFKFMNEINRLDEWPDLPDNKDESVGDMFCRRCKCLLSAKAHSKNEKCPIDNPAWDTEVNVNG